MNDRQRRLLELLRERREMVLAEMVQELGVSEATMRRDLIALESSETLVRTFGGARFREPPSLVVRTFKEKSGAMSPAKVHIAQRAAELVSPGMTIALDSGSTTWRLATALRDKAPLRIVTNALPVIEELGDLPKMSIFCVGGRFNRGNLDFVWSAAATGFSGFRADGGFVGIDSLIPGRGAFADTQEDADVILAIRGISDRVVVVADHTKLEARGMFRALDVPQIDCVVIDADLDARMCRRLQADGYELLIE